MGGAALEIGRRRPDVIVRNLAPTAAVIAPAQIADLPANVKARAALGEPYDRGEDPFMLATLMPYLLVGLGGFVGANARFVVALVVGAAFETKFPLGTFIINISGSFLLGALSTIVTQKVMPNSEGMRLALGVGFLGAYTTFSTFEFETHALFDDGSWLTASMNMLASLLVGLIAVRAGIVAAKSWLT